MFHSTKEISTTFEEEFLDYPDPRPPDPIGAGLWRLSRYHDALNFVALAEFSEAHTGTPSLSQPVLRITRHSVPFRGSATVPTISSFLSRAPRKGANPYIRTPRQLYSPECLERLCGKCSAGVIVTYAGRHGEQEIPHRSVRQLMALYRPAPSPAHRTTTPKTRTPKP
jgi:hypothetical protein